MYADGREEGKKNCFGKNYGTREYRRITVPFDRAEGPATGRGKNKRLTDASAFQTNNSVANLIAPFSSNCFGDNVGSYRRALL